jgi:hypothetical protein
MAAENWMKESSDEIIEFLEDIQTHRARFPNLRTVRVWFTEILGPKRTKNIRGWDQAKVDELATAVGIRVSIEPSRAPPFIARLSLSDPELK